METIFGSNKSSRENTNGLSQTLYNPQDAAAVRAQQANVMNAGQRQNQFLSSLQGQANPQGQAFKYGYKTDAGLGTNFQAPTLTGELGQIGQQTLSNALGQSRAALGTQQAQLAQQFRNNPALAQILQQQAATQNTLNNNPLAFQAKQAENQAVIQNAGLQNQALEQANAARLAGSQFQNQGIGQYNQQVGANYGLASQLGQQQLGNQNAMLESLQTLAKMFGQNVTENRASSLSGSEGILGKFTGGKAGLSQSGVGQS